VLSLYINIFANTIVLAFSPKVEAYSAQAGMWLLTSLSIQTKGLPVCARAEKAPIIIKKKLLHGY
jgi:hypothetical protein